MCVARAYHWPVPASRIATLASAWTPVVLWAGVSYVSFRVRNGTLEQKNGMFDRTTDKPGAAFFPIMENVEDLQVAYIYGRGAQAGNVWNTVDRKSTRLNSSHSDRSRMPSSA